MTTSAPRLAMTLGAAVLVLAACAPVRDDTETHPPIAEIDGLVIRNELPYPVHDFMVDVPATGGFAGCGMILGRSPCSVSFPSAAYRGEALVIRWTEHGESHSIRDVVLDPPKEATQTPKALLEVTIFASGQAAARLVSGPAP